MENLSEELFEQARTLVPRSPALEKAAIRRAISTAYYSLFHLLLDSFQEQFGGYRRAVSHSGMAKASEAVRAIHEAQRRNRAFRAELRALPISGERISDDLARVAENFVDLQAARHLADYDVEHPHSREDALISIEQCREARSAWMTARGNPEARHYLTMFIIEARDLIHR